MLPQNISPDELLARFAFWRVNGVGPALMAECLREFQSIKRLFEQQAELPEALISLLKKADWRAAEKDLQWLSATGHHLVLLGADDFPLALTEISQAPPWLFVKGNVEGLMSAQIAMVGSRNPTHYGVKTAQMLARELSDASLAVTSGLALGIDAVCHQATLDAKGCTIGVLAVGLDSVYPKRHQKLAEEIVQAGGALVSEFGVGVKPIPENFPRRNRIVSGLSLGTIVIEATIKSGSLITARYAAEQGREVFAVPGSIFQPLAQGCHALIKQGAKCVENVNDLLQELPVSLGLIVPTQAIKNNKVDMKNLSRDEQQLMQKLSDIPQTFEVLLAQLPWPANQLQSLLSQLMIKGHVQQDWFGYCLGRED